MTDQAQLTTVEAFEAFLADHDDRRFELIDGEIVEKMPTDVWCAGYAGRWRSAAGFSSGCENNILSRVIHE